MGGGEAMEKGEFTIGLEFWCGNKRWRCTDVGTRVITAICLEPREMVRIEDDPLDKSKRIQRLRCLDTAC